MAPELEGMRKRGVHGSALRRPLLAIALTLLAACAARGDDPAPSASPPPSLQGLDAAIEAAAEGRAARAWVTQTRDLVSQCSPKSTCALDDGILATRLLEMPPRGQEIALALLEDSATRKLLGALQRSSHARHEEAIALIEARFVTIEGILVEGPRVSHHVAQAVIEAMLEHTPALAKRIEQAEAKIALIPRGVKGDEVFGEAKRNETILGWYDGLRRVALTPPSDFAAAAFNGAAIPRILVHEVGHMVHHLGMPEEDSRSVSILFHDGRRAERIRGYAARNPLEYFAVSSELYFGVRGDSPEAGRVWLEQRDPDMFQILRRLYGPARLLHHAGEHRVAAKRGSSNGGAEHLGMGSGPRGAELLEALTKRSNDFVACYSNALEKAPRTCEQTTWTGKVRALGDGTLRVDDVSGPDEKLIPIAKACFESIAAEVNLGPSPKGHPGMAVSLSGRARNVELRLLKAWCADELPDCCHQLANNIYYGGKSDAERAKGLRMHRSACKRGSAWSCNNLAWIQCHELNECGNEALAAPRRAVAHKPNGSTWDTLGVLLCELGQKSEGGDAFHRACVEGNFDDCGRHCD